MSRAPRSRGMLAGCTVTPSRPKWSITMDAMTCPARNKPTVVAAPRRGVRTIEAHTAEPHPPGRVHDGPKLGHGATHDSGGREEDHGPNEKRERGCQNRAADDLAQLAVYGELRWGGHPSGERHG